MVCANIAKARCSAGRPADLVTGYSRLKIKLRMYYVSSNQDGKQIMVDLRREAICALAAGCGIDNILGILSIAVVCPKLVAQRPVSLHISYTTCPGR